MPHRCWGTALLHPVTSERGVCGGPLAFHYANIMSHSAFRQSVACVSLLYRHCAKQSSTCTPTSHGYMHTAYQADSATHKEHVHASCCRRRCGYCQSAASFALPGLKPLGVLLTLEKGASKQAAMLVQLLACSAASSRHQAVPHHAQHSHKPP
jgi:hypothetical protein